MLYHYRCKDAWVDGVEFIRRLKKTGNNVPVIVMTGHADVPLAVEAMKVGAIDFLEKPFRDDRLLEVVRFALLCDEQSIQKSQELLRTQARLQGLSQRERQVLDGLVAGKANKAIAHELNISPRTVEIHRANVMAKMEAKNLPDLIRMALFLEGTPTD
jgi:two-component system response regulator FixJ